VRLDSDPDDMIRRVEAGGRNERYFYDHQQHRFLPLIAMEAGVSIWGRSMNWPYRRPASNPACT
jgi:hypothetical protein